jgi:hypothetical protein
MNGNGYMIGAYAVGLTLLWGYAIALLRTSRGTSNLKSQISDAKPGATS